MFLEIHIDRRPKTPYVYGLFRETYRHNGRVCHRTRGRVTGLSHEQLLRLRDFMKRGCPGNPLDGCPGGNHSGSSLRRSHTPEIHNCA